MRISNKKIFKVDYIKIDNICKKIQNYYRGKHLKMYIINSNINILNYSVKWITCISFSEILEFQKEEQQKQMI